MRIVNNRKFFRIVSFWKYYDADPGKSPVERGSLGRTEGGFKWEQQRDSRNWGWCWKRRKGQLSILECMFKEPVRSLPLLDICAYVYGSLALALSVEGSTSVRLDRVEGDVFTSEVPVERLEFLLNTDIYGKFGGNSFWTGENRVLESSLCDLGVKKRGCRAEGTTEMSTVATTGREEEWTTAGEGERTTTEEGTTGRTSTRRSTVIRTSGGTRETTERTEGAEGSVLKEEGTTGEQSMFSQSQGSGRRTTPTAATAESGSFPYR